jgi:hypothetical protein
MSRLNEYVEVRDIARHIRRMAMRVRAAADLAQVAPKGGLQGGVSGSGCSSGECSSGGCANNGCPASAGAEPLPAQSSSGPGWWVLAQGGPLDESDFAAREAAREELLARVRRAGILVGENVWVWDLSGRAQLVLTTLPTLERARKLAQRLRAKGLAIVVRREMGEGPHRR